MESQTSPFKIVAAFAIGAIVGGVLYGLAGALVGVGLVLAYIATRLAARWFAGGPSGD